MAWEWVAPVCTGAAGSIGVFFTWLSSHQGRKHAERVAEQAAVSQKDRSREERRATAYLDVLTSVNNATFTINSLTALMKTGGEPEPDPLPTQSDQAVLKAKVTAHGSPEARAIFDEWYELARTVMNLHTVLRMDVGLDASRADLWKQQEAGRKSLNEAVKRLNDQVSSDLTR